ncbi:protein-export membrane protein SecD [Saccharospirillum sp. MSK14-1]|uniref:protein translocase subunit SecD n=1 Tax=Saccharospirillum sp. MSK14-1 TaxID=1897632 RepID=UPI000D3737EC|nr:protein translocase subunit SecD [Saccharospirillum sp. MSK14-1]PTY35905.1 protein-export membrane protein SecD [Saccharospirillum sp. MSK14-1]
MLNKYPLWKYAIVVVVLALGILYSLPNLFPADPAVQVRGADAGMVMNQTSLNRITSLLDDADIDHFGEEIVGQSALVRLNSNDDQLDAKAAIQRGLGSDYIVALNLAPTTPDWLTAIGAQPMALGLDLSGGVHFLLEVDMDRFIDTQLNSYSANIRRSFREENIRYRGVDVLDDDSIQILLADTDFRDQAEDWLRDNLPDFQHENIEARGLPGLSLTLTEARINELQDYAVSQNRTTLNNRVNELGVAEPLVQRQGENRIVVELPGVQDTAQAKNILGKSANLEFRLEATSGGEVFPMRSSQGGRGTASLERDVIVTGDNVTDARTSYDQNGLPQVQVSLDGEGGSRMGQVTRSNIGRPMGVLFIEQKSILQRYEQQNGEAVPVYDSVEEKEIISLATIRGAFSNSFVITGLDSPQEASELALLLRAGALAAPMSFVEERTIGPSLGAENIRQGTNSVIIAFALVILFMVAWYKVFGVFASVALGANLVLIVAVMSLMSATLTLPGIAGIVLTVGMAVDANVLIFSRIREELAEGRPPQAAIDAGYGRAFVTILDANITTLIVAVILFAIGTGPVKGFAVTLSVGILTSMFTAIMLTRALANLTFGGRALKKLPI